MVSWGGSTFWKSHYKEVNYIRSSGFWVINCNSVVRSYILKCVTCRRLREIFQQQKMFYPSDRLCKKPPFTYCGIYLLGPFVSKEGCKELKCYTALFTCLAELSTGNIWLLRSNNGTNFVEVSYEFKKAFTEVSQQRINISMRDNVGEWMLCKQNLPAVSDMCGV